MDTDKAIASVAEERTRQKDIWGNDEHSIFEWVSILGEEYGELCQAVNECYLPNQRYPQLGTHESILREATHVAAIAVAIIEQENHNVKK